MSFGLSMFRDMFSTQELSGCTLTLVDLDEEYLDRMYQLAIKMNAQSGAGMIIEKTTDRSGMTYFRITDPGVWRIEFHHAELLENDADAGWVIYSATLTFEVPTQGAGK